MSDAPSLIVLAAGRSTRFGAENKLLSKLSGQPVALRSAKLWAEKAEHQKIVVLPSSEVALERIYAANGWTIVRNMEPERGQSSSLKLGLKHAMTRQAQSVIISLADMPFITDVHLDRIAKSLAQHDAAISKSKSAPCPPVGFKSPLFAQILSISGDSGAFTVFKRARKTIEIVFPDPELLDIDTALDLQMAREMSKTNA